MKTQQNAFYLFLSLARGSWRNAIFIDCKNKCSKECAGWLMTADTEGVPMLYPVSLFEEKADVVVDKAECAAVISRETFETVYDRWLLWNVSDKSDCSICQASANRTDIIY